jgi:hypothetical protein
MLTAVATGVSGYSYRLSVDGADVGELTLSSWTASGTLVLGRQTWDVRRDGWLGPFTLESGGRPVARAVPVGFWRLSFTLTFNEEVYDLRAEFLSSGMVVSCGKAQVGEVIVSGLFRKTLDLHGAESLPPEVQAFIAWLVARRNRQQSGG